MAPLLTAAGETRDVTPADGAPSSLVELQRFVGGYIEALRTPTSWMFLNEDGKRLELPVNDAPRR